MKRKTKCGGSFIWRRIQAFFLSMKIFFLRDFALPPFSPMVFLEENFTFLFEIEFTVQSTIGIQDEALQIFFFAWKFSYYVTLHILPFPPCIFRGKVYFSFRNWVYSTIDARQAVQWTVHTQIWIRVPRFWSFWNKFRVRTRDKCKIEFYETFVPRVFGFFSPSVAHLA